MRGIHSGRAPAARRRARGAGLIEVLVAVLVMAIGLLGIAAMQATALRNSQSSTEQSMAVVYSYSIIDAMRANRDAALANAYNIGMTCAPPAVGTLAQTDLNAWLTSMQQAQSLGPAACGQIQRNGDMFIVTVRWDDRRATGAAAADNKSIETRTRL
ncbi:type IV pilus modification protein PilV [Lysobacter spongiae]|uniref:Type IV pilus modification protein PilV n=2 Tax=Marilutibacter spongiae TaxID=2025720 RepID=A0A7W3TL56_9GAMM|nr:type IV pilus modification protein PilV [Lysobacter spongiae]